MRTISCDRCGYFITNNDIPIDESTPSDMVIFARYDCLPERKASCKLDLCKDCKKSFIEWLGKDIPDNSIPAPVYRPRQKNSTKKEKNK